MLLTQLFEAPDAPESKDAEMPEDENWVPQYRDTALIKADHLGALQQKVDEINKKAIKLDVTPVTIEETGKTEFRLSNPDDKTSHKIKYVEVKIIGEAPKLAGWKFAATIEHTEAGNIVRAVPGEENSTDIHEFFNAQPFYCDWCKTQRRRVDTFIVRNVSGELKQVGRNCLRDFLGGKDPKLVLAYFQFFDNIHSIIGEMSEEQDRRMGGRSTRYTEVKSVLEIASALSREFGYLPAKAEPSTSYMVRYCVFPPTFFNEPDKEQKRWLEVAKHPMEDDTKQAETILNWFQELPQEQKEASTFMRNLEVILRMQHIEPKHVGFVCGLIAMYKRAVTDTFQNELDGKRGAKKSNEWVGTVGEKLIPTDITVVRTNKIDSQFGVVQIVTMEDSVGNLLTWFNSGSYDLEQGDAFTIIGTIKGHGMFGDRKQTVLKRVREYIAPIKKVKAPKAPKIQVVRPEQPANAVVPTNVGVQPAVAQQPAANVVPGQSKMAQATALFSKMTQDNNNTTPTRSQFMQLLMQEPFNMGQAAASTYFQNIRVKYAKQIGESYSFKDFLLDM